MDLFIADGHAERPQTQMELFGACNDDTDHPNVLVDFHSMFNNQGKDWEMILESASGAPPEPSLFD